MLVVTLSNDHRGPDLPDVVVKCDFVSSIRGALRLGTKQGVVIIPKVGASDGLHLQNCGLGNSDICWVAPYGEGYYHDLNIEDAGEYERDYHSVPGQPPLDVVCENWAKGFDYEWEDA